MCIPKSAISQERGLTLVELVMFIVIVSVAVVGILQVLNLTAKQSADPQLRKQALSIAEGLLEEVELAHFTYCDPSDATAGTATSAVIGPNGCTAILESVGQAAPEPINNRPFDNVNDYVNAFGTPVTYTQDAAGNAINVTGAYTAKITINPEPALGPAGALVTAAGGAAVDDTPVRMEALHITVTVSYNHGNDSVTLDGYRTRYAPNAMP